MTSGERQVGLLHPGEMGSFVGAAVRSAGHRVQWVGAGRSAATHLRATDFEDAGDLPALVAAADAIVSVCPPGKALDVATAVAALGFTGLYVDANAVSPATVARVAAELLDARVVDGAIIGGPSVGDAVLHLAGADAVEAAGLFAADRLPVRVLEGPFGSASALKASYAATSKAVTALLLTSYAAATAAGVEDVLRAEWDRTQPGLAARTDAAAARIGAKAWRFGAEMTEAAEFFRAAGAPAGFSAVAAETFDRLADLKDREQISAAEIWTRLAAGT